MNHIAQQLAILSHEHLGTLLITSGAVKYGRILGGKGLSKNEATKVGFDPLMKAWEQSLQSMGLLTITLAITGQSLTKKWLNKLKNQISQTNSATAFIINTRDDLNLSAYKFASVAANNDLVGEKFAQELAKTLVIGTNVNGVLDNQSQTIHDFTDYDQLKNITFYRDPQGNGTGGMETKLMAAIRHAQSGEGKTAFIVNGREENVILKALRGEKIGTKVHLLAAEQNRE